LTEAMKLGPCQVRSNTESPCRRRAEVEILGVAFCEPCARVQEAYFAIGKLTQEEEQDDARRESLAAVLNRMRRERASGGESVIAEMHDGPSGVDDSVPIALGSG
jgi:predicted Fe-S protein YdhL (DUF1289 family)